MKQEPFTDHFDGAGCGITRISLRMETYSSGPRGNDEKGNDEKVGAEDEGAPVGKEMRFAREVIPRGGRTCPFLLSQQ